MGGLSRHLSLHLVRLETSEIQRQICMYLSEWRLLLDMDILQKADVLSAMGLSRHLSLHLVRLETSEIQRQICMYLSEWRLLLDMDILQKADESSKFRAQSFGFGSIFIFWVSIIHLSPN